jgi:hypothetical protein
MEQGAPRSGATSFGHLDFGLSGLLTLQGQPHALASLQQAQAQQSMLGMHLPPPSSLNGLALFSSQFAA